MQINTSVTEFEFKPETDFFCTWRGTVNFTLLTAFINQNFN